MGSKSSVPHLTSIIIPAFNQLCFSRLCLIALAGHTVPQFELIVVDNGSTDGTASYLLGVQDHVRFPLKIVSNPKNLGFPAACNQGLREAIGDYLVLLNNDTVVTEGWLEQLIALADSSPTIGMTGPMSNYVSPPQLIEPISYGNLEEMHMFASTWRTTHRGEWFKTPKLSGFCVLIKRQAIDAIGLLDEHFGLGLFDDDDLAIRAARAGFSLAVARDAFVHHFGSRTFAGMGVDTQHLLAHNRALLERKWGLSLDASGEVKLDPWTSILSSSKGGVAISANHMHDT